MYFRLNAEINFPSRLIWNDSEKWPHYLITVRLVFSHTQLVVMSILVWWWWWMAGNSRCRKFSFKQHFLSIVIHSLSLYIYIKSLYTHWSKLTLSMTLHIWSDCKTIRYNIIFKISSMIRIIMKRTAIYLIALSCWPNIKLRIHEVHPLNIYQLLLLGWHSLEKEAEEDEKKIDEKAFSL